MGYMTNFIVYILAMVGVIVLAVLLYKTTTSSTIKGGTKYLKVHDTLALGPRKTLYIVSAGEEKFLIAGDLDRTTLISKLGESKEQVVGLSSLKTKSGIEEETSYQSKLDNISTKSSYMDKSVVGIYKTQNKPYDSVMKNLAERIRQ